MISGITACNIVGFLLPCEERRGLGQNTLYDQDISKFKSFLKSGDELKVFDGALVLKYLGYMLTTRSSLAVAVRAAASPRKTTKKRRRSKKISSCVCYA